MTEKITPETITPETIEKQKLRQVVEAAKLLYGNWDEGLSAQAFYRDTLVDKMVEAGLLPISTNGSRP